MRDNILRIAFKDTTEITARALYQYDYGQILKFVDIDLPYTYEVHFSNFMNNSSITNIGNADGVAIPDALLQTGLPIYVWVYLHTGLNDGETEYKVIIPINKRAQPSNDEPSQVQQDIITQTLAALSSAMAIVTENTATTTQASEDAIAAKNLARQYMNLTASYKEAVENVVTDRYIRIGSTTLNETQLQRLLALIED